MLGAIASTQGQFDGRNRRPIRTFCIYSRRFEQLMLRLCDVSSLFSRCRRKSN
jgi:hypothetical protein